MVGAVLFPFSTATFSLPRILVCDEGPRLNARIHVCSPRPPKKALTVLRTPQVYGEFNLFQEGEALQEFQNTKIGRHPLFRVVKLYHHSPKCLVEEIAIGPTLAAVLENVGTVSSPINNNEDAAGVVMSPY